MSRLTDYLKTHAIRCAPEEGADVMFFAVKESPDARADELKELMQAHQGEFSSLDPFDGLEHGYIELGGWLGDQGLALTLIGLGARLGLWALLTPRTVLGTSIPEDVAMQMAQAGMVTMRVCNAPAEQAT